MEKDIKNAEFDAMTEEEIQDSIVVLTDDEGNESYFIEEMVLPVGDKQFAILVGINEDCCEDEECHCHDHEDEDENVIIARIEFNEEGEPEYVAPTDEEFEAVKENVKSDIRIQRAKHAVYENQRTVKAVEALQNNDVTLFGELMNASHVSLRDDYEVTGIELDTLVEEAWKVEGVIGSRMTGAGFGGCTVSIVKDEAVENFIAQVGKAYEEKIGYAADFYVVEIGDGPQKLA